MAEYNFEEEEDDEYWHITWKSVPRILVYIITIGILIVYANNQTFKTWVTYNLEYIHSSYDVMILFYLVFVIPYLLFWLMELGRLIKMFWVSYEALSIIIFFRKLRINISIFGFVSIFFTFALNMNLTENIWIFAISGAILLVINIILIKKNYYDTIEAEEKIKLETPKEKRTIELTPLQTIAMILAILIPFLYFSFPALQESVNNIGLTLQSDILGIIILIISFAFSFLWFAVPFFILAIKNLYENHKEKLDFYGQMIVLIMVLYVIGKVAIFNLPTLVPDPYPSVISMIISTSTGFITRYSKEIITFIKKGKSKGKGED